MKIKTNALLTSLLILPFINLIAHEAAAGSIVTCKKNSHSCGSKIELFRSRKMTRKVSFLENTDYQRHLTPNWPVQYDQINKTFGVSDCGNYIVNRKDSALVGWRNIYGTNLIELTGYVHRESVRDSLGNNFRSSPLGIVRRNDPNAITIEAMSNYYLYTLRSNKMLVMERQNGCASDIHGRYINTWFGGQKPAPETLRLSVERTSQPPVQFPISLKISDDEVCKSKKPSDPLHYLDTHASGIMARLSSECQNSKGSIKKQYLSCDALATGKDDNEKDAIPYESPNSIPGLNYNIECATVAAVQNKK